MGLTSLDTIYDINIVEMQTQRMIFKSKLRSWWWAVELFSANLQCSNEFRHILYRCKEKAASIKKMISHDARLLR